MANKLLQSDYACGTATHRHPIGARYHGRARSRLPWSLVAMTLAVTLAVTLANATPISASPSPRNDSKSNNGVSSAAQIVTTPLGPPPDAEVLVGPGNRSILARAAAFGPRLPVPPRLLPSEPDQDDDDDDASNDNGSPSLPRDDPPIVAGRLVPLALADPGNHHGCIPVPPSVVAHWPGGVNRPPWVPPLPPSSVGGSSPAPSAARRSNAHTRDQPPLIILPPRPPFAFSSSSSPSSSSDDRAADTDTGKEPDFAPWTLADSASASLDAYLSTIQDDNEDTWPPAGLLPPSANSPNAPWIALVQRGGCAFVDKVRAMQRSGAAAVVVGDDDPSTGAMLVTMYAGGDVSDVLVPAVFIGFVDYTQLVEDAAQQGADGAVEVWLVGNGIDTEEWTVVDMILAAVVAPLILLVGVYALCRACIRSAQGPTGHEGRTGPPEPATSARILASLPTKVFYLAKAREEDCLTCVICLDEFEDDVELVELPCKHTFHGECIQTWLRDRKNVCPICRFELVEDDEDGAGEEEVHMGTPPPPGALDIPVGGLAANHVPPHVVALSVPVTPPRAASAPPASSAIINMPPSPVGRGRRRVRVPSRLAATAAAAAAAAAPAASAAIARSRSADEEEGMRVEDGLETSLGDVSEEYRVQRIASAERTDEEEDASPLSSSPLTEQDSEPPRFVRISVPDVGEEGTVRVGHSTDEQDDSDLDQEEDAPLLGR